MKICKFCDSECDDSEQKCPSCGATEFSNKCGNCGTVFDSGFCPNCGIKAGRKPKICAKCGNEYYSNACPNCGYNDSEFNTLQTVNASQSDLQGGNSYYAQPPKKKITVWTVLLWIFFLPIMAVIAVWKSNKLDKKWKIIITAIIVAVCLVSCATN